MQINRRAFLGLSAAVATTALAAGAYAGWTLLHNGPQPLLLSARNDSAGKHFAVGYRLDGSQVFSTQGPVRRPPPQPPELPDRPPRRPPVTNSQLTQTAPFLRPCRVPQGRRMAARHRARHLRPPDRKN